METSMFVSAFLIILIIIYTLKRRGKKYVLPPGPRGLPFLGNLLDMDVNNLPQIYFRWAKKFGPIFLTRFGSLKIVVINDPSLLKEAFSKDAFSPRPKLWTSDLRKKLNEGTSGIIFAEGDTWKEHRRYTLQVFRDFGVGKLGMEEKIVTETEELIKNIQKKNGLPFDTKLPLSVTVANIVSSVLTGNRYAPDDPEFIRFIELNKQNFGISWRESMLVLLPWLRFFPPIKGTYIKMVNTFQGLRQFFLQASTDHLNNWVPDRNADFVDCYISAVKSDRYQTFSTANIPILLEDIFEAGYETTTTTLRWAFLLMSLHQKVQEKVHKELDTNLPRNVIPKPSDKYDLPYTEATLMEIHRFGSIVPLGVSHCAREDTKLGEFDIPKGTALSANLHYIHHNDDWWNDPETFEPSRFLDKHTQKKFNELVIPFSLGKRRCPGEALARVELFILFTTVMHRFTVCLPEGIHAADLTRLPGITADLKPHLLRFIPRLPCDIDVKRDIASD